MTDTVLTMKRTIHILKHGRSFCSMQGVPADWPEGHVWISFEDPDLPDMENLEDMCPTCKTQKTDWGKPGA